MPNSFFGDRPWNLARVFYDEPLPTQFCFFARYFCFGIFWDIGVIRHAVFSGGRRIKTSTHTQTARQRFIEHVWRTLRVLSPINSMEMLIFVWQKCKKYIWRSHVISWLQGRINFWRQKSLDVWTYSTSFLRILHKKNTHMVLSSWRRFYLQKRQLSLTVFQGPWLVGTRFLRQRQL